MTRSVEQYTIILRSKKDEEIEVGALYWPESPDETTYFLNIYDKNLETDKLRDLPTLIKKTLKQKTKANK